MIVKLRKYNIEVINQNLIINAIEGYEKHIDE